MMSSDTGTIPKKKSNGWGKSIPKGPGWGDTNSISSNTPRAGDTPIGWGSSTGSVNSPRGVKRTNSTSSGWGSSTGSVNSPKAESTRNVTRGVRRSGKNVPSNGAGRGRGRGRTLPAWQTGRTVPKKTVTDDPIESVHKVLRRDRIRKTGTNNVPLGRKRSFGQGEVKPVGGRRNNNTVVSAPLVNRGRGRASTKPAWMMEASPADTVKRSTRRWKEDGSKTSVVETFLESIEHESTQPPLKRRNIISYGDVDGDV